MFVRLLEHFRREAVAGVFFEPTLDVPMIDPAQSPTAPEAQQPQLDTPQSSQPALP